MSERAAIDNADDAADELLSLLELWQLFPEVQTFLYPSEWREIGSVEEAVNRFRGRSKSDKS